MARGGDAPMARGGGGGRGGRGGRGGPAKDLSGGRGGPAKDLGGGRGEPSAPKRGGGLGGGGGGIGGGGDLAAQLQAAKLKVSFIDPYLIEFPSQLKAFYLIFISHYLD